MEHQWYVLHVLSASEHKVKAYIENNMKAKDLEDKLIEILVPSEEVLGLREGKKIKTMKKLLPGYVLVKMVMDDEVLRFLKGIPGVTNFVGSRGKAMPLREEEVNHMIDQAERKAGDKEGIVPFREDDTVKVISGPFSDFSGVVEQVNAEKSKVRVLVSIFGRPTPVELDFLQIELEKPQEVN